MKKTGKTTLVSSGEDGKTTLVSSRELKLNFKTAVTGQLDIMSKRVKVMM
jgi:hypothetical protein